MTLPARDRFGRRSNFFCDQALDQRIRFSISSARKRRAI
jgi:hypothetical protein